MTPMLMRSLAPGLPLAARTPEGRIIGTVRGAARMAALDWRKRRRERFADMMRFSRASALREGDALNGYIDGFKEG